jgi:hypothetical protein
MYKEEQTFALRFTLEASFPDEYEGDEDGKAWVREWDAFIKPRIIKLVFETLRQQAGWICHVRNRGVSPTDEIEIVLSKDFSKTVPFSIRP